MRKSRTRQEMTSFTTSVRFYAVYFLMMLAFGIFKLLFVFPCSRFMILKLFNKIATVELPQEMYMNSLFTRSMFKAHTNMIWRELQRTAKPGQTAPNSSLVDIDGKELCNLLDIAQESRPLVVVFGSCTCPVFMKRMPEIYAIMDDFGAVADFIFVYVQEAHPSDGWAFNGNYEIRQHRTQEERCAAARFFLEQLDRPCNIVVDTMENEASDAYGGPPHRLCIVLKDNVEYLGGIGPAFFRPPEVRAWLEEFITESSVKDTPRHRA